MSKNRETENKITQIMGSYLLKGYTLLDNHCQTCQTPLMKTKTSDLYCIYCKEINPKHDIKKNESMAAKDKIVPMNEDIVGDNQLESKRRKELAINSESPANEAHTDKEVLQRTINIVERKIEWAANRLKACDQIGDCLQLINLMKASADLLLSLNRLSQT